MHLVNVSCLFTGERWLEPGEAAAAGLSAGCGKERCEEVHQMLSHGALQRAERPFCADSLQQSALLASCPTDEALGSSGPRHRASKAQLVTS